MIRITVELGPDDLFLPEPSCPFCSERLHLADG
jgi:hypothetical protein